MKRSAIIGCVVIMVLFLLQSCTSKKTELVWDQSLFQIGSQSSPRAADLNEDGVLDIVMGAGKGELVPTDMGVLALDGKTGKQLWKHAASAQMVGAATFQDITADGTPDVFIGGRNNNLKALDGKTGALLWEYLYEYESDPILQYAHFNFYNSTLVPDQNDDGYPDLLTVNGGNWNVAPGDLKDRYPGVLMVLNIKNGAILAADTMPDGGESYLSPICFTPSGDETPQIIFGTGGETKSGHLYLASLSDLMANNLSNASILASEEDHGFIAPPALADLNQDGSLDIIAITHASKVLGIDGKTKQIIWKKTFPGMESSNALGIGHFNQDKIPDIFAVMCKGVWPSYTTSQQIVLNGQDGSTIHQDAIGCFQVSSPVIYDLNNDGYDEAIMSINDYDCSTPFTEENMGPKEINNQLIAIDFHKEVKQVIDQTDGFKNIYSTPWIGDLDGDKYLDIIYCQYLNTADFSQFLGMRVKRISTSIRARKTPEWGEYMGQSGKGIFPME